MPHSIYWLKHKNHSDLLTEGYIGVSNNPKERIRHHFKNANGGYHSDKVLSKAIKKYGKDQIIVDILVIGDKEYCYETEKKLRPASFTGWNMREGGYHIPNPFPKGSKRPQWISNKASATTKAKRDAGIKMGKDRLVSINGNIFNTVKTAREAYNISSSQIKRLLQGASGGYKFGHLEVKYADY
jgi:predicted GIY-YIG superfamily endonuclease